MTGRWDHSCGVTTRISLILVKFRFVFFWLAKGLSAIFLLRSNHGLGQLDQSLLLVLLSIQYLYHLIE